MVIWVHVKQNMMEHQGLLTFLAWQKLAHHPSFPDADGTWVFQVRWLWHLWPLGWGALPPLGHVSDVLPNGSNYGFGDLDQRRTRSALPALGEMIATISMAMMIDDWLVCVCSVFLQWYMRESWYHQFSAPLWWLEPKSAEAHCRWMTLMFGDVQ